MKSRNYKIRMVADITDSDTKREIQYYWNNLGETMRRSLLTEMGHSDKYVFMKFEDLTGEIQSKIVMKIVQVKL